MVWIVRGRLDQTTGEGRQALVPLRDRREREGPVACNAGLAARLLYCDHSPLAAADQS